MCLGVSFSELQKEQRGEETILNLESFSSKYKTLFKTLYWNIRKFVSIFTRRGIRYIDFHSISLFAKCFSKYICDLVLVSFRETYREYNSLLLHLLKERIWYFLMIWCTLILSPLERFSFQAFRMALFNWV